MIVITSNHRTHRTYYRHAQLVVIVYRLFSRGIIYSIELLFILFVYLLVHDIKHFFCLRFNFTMWVLCFLNVHAYPTASLKWIIKSSHNRSKKLCFSLLNIGKVHRKLYFDSHVYLAWFFRFKMKKFVDKQLPDFFTFQKNNKQFI